jgi:predicted kinase
MKKGRIILICGLPGSGKTTLAKKIESEENAIRFCPDDWMEKMGISLWDGKAREGIEQQFWQLAQRLAEQGITSILENGFWSKEERDGYLRTARDLGFKIELQALFIPKDETRKRLEERGMEGDSLILKEKLDSYYDLFEMPSETELAQYDNRL